MSKTVYEVSFKKKVLNHVAKGNSITGTAKKYGIPYNTLQTWHSLSGTKAHTRRDKHKITKFTSTDKLLTRMYNVSSDLLDTLNLALSAKSDKRELVVTTKSLLLKNNQFSTQDIKNLAVAYGVLFDKLKQSQKLQKNSATTAIRLYWAKTEPDLEPNE